MQWGRVFGLLAIITEFRIRFSHSMHKEDCFQKVATRLTLSFRVAIAFQVLLACVQTKGRNPRNNPPLIHGLG